MSILEFDAKEPTQELTEFMNSCENRPSKIWNDCPRVDWMLWFLHNETRYRNIGKILRFTKLLEHEAEESIVEEPESPWESKMRSILRYKIEGPLQYADDLPEMVASTLKYQADLLRSVITIDEIWESFKATA